MPTLLELLWQHVDRGGDHWLWQGAVSSEGYALFTYLGVTRHAHRWVYEETVGPVTKGRVCSAALRRSFVHAAK